MALSSLVGYLDMHHAKYLIITHSPAFTAQGVAGITHISGKELAKTVIVKVDGKLAMAVVPAMFHVDLEMLKKAAHARAVLLASEDEFWDRFPECETGAMPPLGHLYGLPVYADESLARDREIAFNAGTHRELIRMSWADYRELAEPVVTRIVASRTPAAA
ncbi:MAG TPA: YbaK/EbsC family protein [Terracidiphilus sp.]|nr:YbaK/EbsC family protein [Terracidiphilus sp.]